MRTTTTSTKPPCPHCQSTTVVKNGHRPHQDGSQVQNYRCKPCGKQFNERIGTPMFRLPPLSNVSLALKMGTGFKKR